MHGRVASGFARSFDFFAWKRLEDASLNASTLGAFVSLGGALLLLSLFVLETLSFLTPTVQQDIVMSGNSGKPLRITFNMTFPALPCHLITLETTDVLGVRNSNLTSSNIHRWTIDSATGRTLMKVASPKLQPAGRQLVHGDAAAAEAGATDFASTLLDMNSFEPFIRDNDLVLVAFGASWCPWSRRLSPVWEEVAAVVSSVPDVKLGRVDCAANTASQLLCMQQHIAAFPSVMLYKGRVPHSHVHYHGDRSKQDILSFLVAARQDESLSTDPKAPTTLEAHAAADRIARDLQLLEADPNAPHDGAASADAGEAGAAAAGPASAPAAAAGGSAHGHDGHDHGPQQQGAAPAAAALDPAHPGPAQALIEAIHRAGLKAPGDAARAVMAKLMGSGGAEAAVAAAGEGAAGSDVAAAAARRLAAPARTGCQIAGFLDVKRVPGSFRVSPSLDGMSANPAALNMSHVVHDLFFGPRITTYQLSRLPAGTAADLHRMRGAQFVSSSWNTSHEHFVSVVGSSFSFLSGHSVDSYRYSYNSHSFEEEGSGAAAAAFFGAPQPQPSTGGGADAAPIEATPRAPTARHGRFPVSARWSYELSPMSVQVTERRQPLYRWLTSLCAIIGGVFTVLGLLDSALHGIKGSATYKRGINKHT